MQITFNKPFQTNPGRCCLWVVAGLLVSSAALAASDGSAGSSDDAASAGKPAHASVTGEASPHEESILSKAMKKTAATDNLDTNGESWQSIRTSIQQFGHPLFVLRLFLSLTLAVICAWVIAWHPRRTPPVDPLADLEERKTFIILGVVGAIIAELSGTSQTLAFVIFGIGALVRFRTVLDNPKATGKAILVVVIGLACGMGSWTMAVFVTLFSWALLYWLDSRVSCRVRIRLDGDANPRVIFDAVQSLLMVSHCRIHASSLSAKGKPRIEFLVQVPVGLDPRQLEADIRAKFPKIDGSRIMVESL